MYHDTNVGFSHGVCTFHIINCDKFLRKVQTFEMGGNEGYNFSSPEQHFKTISTRFQTYLASKEKYSLFQHHFLLKTPLLLPCRAQHYIQNPFPEYLPSMCGNINFSLLYAMGKEKFSTYMVRCKSFVDHGCFYWQNADMNNSLTFYT